MTTTTDLTVEITQPILAAMKAAARLAPKKHPVRTFEHIRITAEGNDLIIEAANSDVYYQRTVFLPDVTVSTSAAAVLHRDVILNIKAPTALQFGDRPRLGPMVLNPEILPEDFPKAPPEPTSEAINCDRDYFDALEHAALSAAKSEARPILQNICHRGDSLFASDGLSAYWAKTNKSWPQDLVLPASYAATLGKLFGYSGAYMAWNDSHIWYWDNGHKIAIRPLVHHVDGRHCPDVERVFPRSTPIASGTLDRKAWMQALESVISLYKLVKRRDLEFRMTIEGFIEKAVISARAEGHELQQDVPCQASMSFWLRLNAQLLHQALQQLDDSNEVEFEFYGSETPFLLSQRNGHRKVLLAVMTK